MRQSEARELELALHALVESAEEKRRRQRKGHNPRPIDTNDSRHLGIRLTGAQSNSDKCARDRDRLSRADAEAEARRRKRFEAIAYDGPQMARSASHDERRNTDCVHYAGCLDRFVARHCQRGDAHAHCPTPCAYYQREDIRRDARISSSLCVETRIIL